MKLILMFIVVTLLSVQISNSQTCQWAEKFSYSTDTTGHGSAHGMVVDKSGNIYIVGCYNSDSLNFNNGIKLDSSGFLDSYIAKFDPNGKCQWAQKIGGSWQDDAQSIAIDDLCNIYITGEFNKGTLNFNNGVSLTNSYAESTFITKYDSSGTCQWAQKINNSRAHSIIIDRSGDFFVGGEFFSDTLIFNNGVTLVKTDKSDDYVAKYNSNGTCQWAQKISGVGVEWLYSIAVDDPGNVYIAGLFFSDPVSFNNGISLTKKAISENGEIFLAKYNSSGICQWAERISGLDKQYVSKIGIDGLGNSYIVGNFSSTTINFNNGISLTNSSNLSSLIAKYNSSGICQWAETTRNSMYSYASDIALDKMGYIYITGGFLYDSVTFNNGISLSNSGGADVFLTKYSTNGICQWAEKISGTDNDLPDNIAIGSNSDMFVMGMFYSTPLNFNNGISLNSTKGHRDFFIAKYSIAPSAPHITTSSPICEGDNLLLFTDSIPNAKYFWLGILGYKSNQQNPIIKNAKPWQSGKYSLYYIVGTKVSDTTEVDIVINTSLVSPGDSSLIFVGSASKVDNYIKLNDAKPWDGGAVWLKNRFSVKQNFTTTFKFRTRFGDNNGADDSSLPGADGFAFVMQNHNYPVLGDKGGSMGYTGITNSLAIEFDLYKNVWDPNGNHIALQSMGSKPNTADHRITGFGGNGLITTIKQDSIYYVKIEYDEIYKSMDIYLDETGKFEKSSQFKWTWNMGLEGYLQLEEGEYVYIGFTAGTGDAYQEHDIFDWTIPCKNQLVGVEEKYVNYNNSGEMSISPNPTNEYIFICMNKGLQPLVQELDIRIYNVLGEMVKKPNPRPTQGVGVRIDVSQLSPGLYFVRVGDKVNKFVKL